jgi:hypothetical protein
MKQILISLTILFASVTVFAAKDYYKANVYLIDGTVKRGLAKIVETETDEHVFFKKSEEANVEKIEAEKIKKLVYTFDDKEYEYVFIKVYKGWKQVEIRGPIWVEIVDKGIATLYVTSSVIYSRAGTVQQGSVTFHDYYIMRVGEPAAKLIATISTLNNNQTFRAKAPIYFSDYPELAAKIKNKEYTWKNLEEVVRIYNNWAKTKKK